MCAMPAPAARPADHDRFKDGYRHVSSGINFSYAGLLMCGLLSAVGQRAGWRQPCGVGGARGRRLRADQVCQLRRAAISGEELLNRSGMTVVLNSNAGLGGAVCSINGYGCAYPTQDCFCKCQGSSASIGLTIIGRARAWQYSQVGPTGYQVKNGALEGWSWGQGNFSSGTIPPTVKFEDTACRRRRRCCCLARGWPGWPATCAMRGHAARAPLIGFDCKEVADMLRRVSTLVMLVMLIALLSSICQRARWRQPSGAGGERWRRLRADQVCQLCGT